MIFYTNAITQMIDFTYAASTTIEAQIQRPTICPVNPSNLTANGFHLASSELLFEIKVKIQCDSFV